MSEGELGGQSADTGSSGGGSKFGNWNNTVTRLRDEVSSPTCRQLAPSLFELGYELLPLFGVALFRKLLSEARRKLLRHFDHCGEQVWMKQYAVWAWSTAAGRLGLNWHRFERRHLAAAGDRCRLESAGTIWGFVDDGQV